MSVYKASRVYGVTESTLRDRTHGLQPTGDLPYAGPGPLFSKNEESQLVEHELDKVLKAHNLHESPESIWNIDETGLQTEHSPRKILCMQGEKANTVTSNRGQTVT
ncbi:hypothetical protein MAR_031299 [Mya arenaria]|uniref:HTH psq-type domain-containing protein n=1 Tax=Mya arenaria TaxID=6604 RepID=A0ABY7F4L9_MYAAR|nr:hypothetical protein MAR_031299 [Mya arenaria]